MTTAGISESDHILFTSLTISAFSSLARFSARAASWSQTYLTLTSLRVFTSSTKPGVWMWAAPTKATVIFLSLWAQVVWSAAAATAAALVVFRNSRRVRFEFISVI